MSMSTSRQGVLFIACREALVLSAYDDGPHCSVGFGHQAPGMKAGTTITAAEAFRLLKEDIASREPTLRKWLKVPVSQQQWDACMSLHYNSGSRYMPDVAALMNAGNMEGAANLFLLCDRNLAGQQSVGLHKRRVLEKAIFETGDYGDLTVLPYWPGDPRKTRMQQYRVKPEDI